MHFVKNFDFSQRRFDYPALSYYLGGLLQKLLGGNKLAPNNLYSVITVVLLFSFFRRKSNGNIGFITSSLFLLSSLIWTRNLHLTIVDMPLTFMGFLACFICYMLFSHYNKLSLMHVALIGAMTGLTASMKYNGGIIAFALAVPIILNLFKNKTLLIKAAIVYFLFSLMAFMFTNPFILTNFEKFSDAMIQIYGFKGGSHLGYTAENGLFHHLFISLPDGFGLFPYIGGIFGLAWFCFQSEEDKEQKLSIILYPSLFLLLMGLSRLNFQRYVLPLIPFLSLGIGILVIKLQKTLQRSKSLYIFYSVIILALSYNISFQVKYLLLMFEKDTREIYQKSFTDFTIRRYKKGELISCSWCDLYIKPVKDRFYKIKRSLNKDLYKENASIISFNSFSDDRLIYDKVSDRSKSKFFKKYTNIKGYYVVKMSPYKFDKTRVPFAPESLYTVEKMDLMYRIRPGPYIETYFRSMNDAKMFTSICRSNGGDCRLVSLRKNYYLKEISGQQL